jgi:hypothetical protein
MDSTVKKIKPSKDSKWKLELSKIQILWSSIIIVLCILFMSGLVAFLWKRELFDFDYPIDSSAWGTFGDYIGGVLGTIVAFFSIYLLIKTLNNQIDSNEKINKVNEQNIAIYTLQQFHDTFNTLVSLYHNSIEAFKIDDEQKGKKFFHEQVKKLQNDFTDTTSNYEQQVKKTVDAFNTFYTKYREYAAVYFKLLYRVFQLIDSSKIPEHKKAEYAKIVRCQLSEDEMFLLRYNAMTQNGRKMQTYVNRYNLLKHLTTMSLLEFTTWRNKLSLEVERNYLDSLFINIRKLMMSALLSQSDSDKKFEQETEDKKYCIKGEISQNNTSVKLEIIRNNKIKNNKNNTNQETLGSALDKFTDDEILGLIDAFVKEVFIFSNFSIYADILNMVIEKDVNKAVGQKQDTFWITIKPKDNYPLILSQRQIEVPKT